MAADRHDLCSIPGCQKPVRKRRLCSGHNHRLERYGDPLGGPGRTPEHHGRQNTPEYRSWQGIIQRCCNPNDTSYPSYGARGITVCEAWRLSFLAFLADMGERPTPDHSVDRMDNDGPYEPGNCRWATRSEQQRNRRSNRLITLDGRTLTVAEWSVVTGLSRFTIHTRLRLGWDAHRTLTTPPDRRRQRKDQRQ